MASEQAAVSATASVFTENLSDSATIPTTSPIDYPESDPIRTRSLKRSRPKKTQNPAHLTSITNAGLGASSSPKSPRFKGTFSPGFPPTPPTGTAALADERRLREESRTSQSSATSENLGHIALSSLMAGGGAGMSRLQDTPVSTTVMSEGMSIAANPISTPSPMQYEEKTGTSPTSVTSLASLGSIAPTTTASSTAIASPAALSGAFDTENRDGRAGVANQLQAPVDDHSSNRALSFPGNILENQVDPSRFPSRGLSLPMPGQNQQVAPRSPSQKKHKCPYCETEFTRHHNLKSHLLTHSQEKPYVCDTCSMRFRRLHDLKRHMKLHTGERPHICPKCDRKFARGDALARHSKGQGGCAGRRASMGSFVGDDDYDGSNAGDGNDGMDGVLYSNGVPQEGEMTEEERRRLSLPTIKAQHVPGNQGSQDSYISRATNTYPPTGARPGQSTGGLHPPNADRGGSSSSGTSPTLQNNLGSGHTPGNNLSSMALSAGGGSMFAQSGMTESPKPLSPAGMHSHQLGHDPLSINRQRSPSLTTQFQQQHFGRRQSDKTSPTNMSLPSPHSSSQGPKLPAISGLAPPDQRYTLSIQTPTQQNPNGSHPVQQGQSITGSTSPSSIFQPSLAGQGGNGPHQPGSGDSSANLFAAGDRGVWAYVQTLEDKVKQLSDKMHAMETKEKSQGEKITRLQDEVKFLRGQLQMQNPSQYPPGSGPS
jgi:hypothetical protein